MGYKRWSKEVGRYMIDIRYKWYRMKWILAPKFHLVTKFPTCINIDLTNVCNLKCIMCFNDSKKMKKGFMNVELFKKIIDECKMYKLDSVKLSWRGEPLIHKNLFDMIDYVKDSGIREVFLNTNALLFDSNKMEKIIDSGINAILISIDGSDKNTYERIRKGGNFDILDNNIRELVKVRNSKGLDTPKIKLHAVRMKENNDSINLLYDKYKNVVDDIFISNETMFFDTERSVSNKEIKKIERKSCDQLWQRLAITWDGSVAMCCNDWIPKNVLGNVRTETIYDIWHGEKITHIRKLHKQLKFADIDVCFNCVCQESCKK